MVLISVFCFHLFVKFVFCLCRFNRFLPFVPVLPVDLIELRTWFGKGVEKPAKTPSEILKTFGISTFYPNLMLNCNGVH